MSSILTDTVKRLSLLYKVFAMLVTAALIVVIFPHEGRGEHYDYKIGAVWRGADLVAPYDFVVLKDAEQMKSEQEAERRKATIYYRVDSSAYATALADAAAPVSAADVIFLGFPIWWYREPSLIDIDNGDAVITAAEAVRDVKPGWKPDRYNTFWGRNKHK